MCIRQSLNTIQNMNNNGQMTGLTSFDSSRVRQFEDERENIHEQERANFRESVKMIALERDLNTRFNHNTLQQDSIKYDFLPLQHKETEPDNAR